MTFLEPSPTFSILHLTTSTTAATATTTGREAEGEAVLVEETLLITSRLVSSLTNVSLNNYNTFRFGGKDYLVSWRIGCSQFTQAGAEHFCRQNGMR